MTGVNPNVSTSTLMLSRTWWKVLTFDCITCVLLFVMSSVPLMQVAVFTMLYDKDQLF